MTICKLNKRLYVSSMHGRGIYGKYSKVLLQHGHGIVDGLGRVATKHVLGGIGRSTGSHFGKQLGKLIGQKTGSQLLGSIAKAGLSSIGGFGGEKLGSTVGHLLGNTVFADKEKKKKKEPPKVSLSQLLEQARSKILPAQSAHGIMQLNY